MNTTKFNEIPAGVCAPKGFKAYGMHCGIRKNTDKLDLALVTCDKVCNAAGVYTKNKVFAAPVGVTRKHLSDGKAQAIICNSGNANACNIDGYETAEATAAALAEKLGIKADDVVVCSTGVIGVSLAVEPIIGGMPTLIEKAESTAEAADLAARAIMTTDLKKKEFALSFELGGKIVKLGGMCKGSGMIHPNMATMLVFITTDAAISSPTLQAALTYAINDTFNMVSVDGDTSTNDTVVVLASGYAENSEITDTASEDYAVFAAALRTLCMKMARAIAADGEGATKLLLCEVTNFSDDQGARELAKSVIASSLVKTAMFGADANWGRVICALGYSGVEFDTKKVDISFSSEAGTILVCENGMNHDFSEDEAKKILSCDTVTIHCDMKSGDKSATAFGCDLSYEYVRINGDYRS